MVWQNYVRTMRAEQACPGFVDDCYWKDQAINRMESVNSSLDVAITHASDSRDQKVAPETDRGPSPRPCVVASRHVSADVEMRSISDDVPTRARRHGPNHSLSGESTTSPTRMSDASLRSGRDLTSVERPAKQRRTEPTSEPGRDPRASGRHGQPPRSQSKQDRLDPRAKKRQQLLLFIKRILDPYFAAGLIERETYKRIAGRALDKVLATHRREETADFILSDGMRIRSLIEEYVLYYRKESK